MNKKPGLSKKQKAFCREYVIDFNATQAAVRAGYSKKTANQQGPRLLVNVGVQEYIKALTAKAAEKNELTVESVLNDIAEVKKRCLQAIPVLDKDGSETGEYKFDPSSALKACELEGKYLAMFTDKLKLDAPVTADFTVNFVDSKPNADTDTE